MNIRDLQYFLTVAEMGHFSKAAERCCVSQPTLSGQIKKLEDELGVTLLERSNRRVMLTDAGMRIAESARRLLQEADAIRDIATTSHDPLQGTFQLGAFPTLSTYIFPKLVPPIKAAMPELRLILAEDKTDQLIEKLRHGDIDAALLALPVHEEWLESAALFDDAFFLAVPPDHALAKRKRISHEHLKGQSVLLLEEGHCLRDQALEVCQLHGIGEEQDFKATGMETLRNMVKAGTGITFIPEIAMQPDETNITYIPFAKPTPMRTIGLVWRKTSTKRAIIDHLIECIACI